MTYIILLIIILIIYLYYLHNKTSELLTSPGYANRIDVSSYIPITFGGSDGQFKKDIRFGI